MHYTKNYHLPQWEKSDRIMMDDFNAMCGNLEAGLEKTASDASKRSDQIQASADAAMAAANRAQQSAEAAQETAGSAYCPGNLPYSIGMYYGNGEKVSITLGYTPQFLIITAQSEQANNEDICGVAVIGNMRGSSNMLSSVTFLDNGFTVQNPGGVPNVGGQFYPMMNQRNKVYYYIAFR